MTPGHNVHGPAPIDADWHEPMEHWFNTPEPVHPEPRVIDGWPYAAAGLAAIVGSACAVGIVIWSMWI